MAFSNAKEVVQNANDIGSLKNKQKENNFLLDFCFGKPYTVIVKGERP